LLVVRVPAVGLATVLVGERARVRALGVGVEPVEDSAGARTLPLVRVPPLLPASVSAVSFWDDVGA